MSPTIPVVTRCLVVVNPTRSATARQPSRAL
jgi:hypothetical protein